MEDNFLQCIAKNTFKKPPRFSEMEKEELISYIKKNCITKEHLITFIKATYLATQQSFFESYQKGEDVDFRILEGYLHYDVNTGVFTFTPNSTVKKLINKAEDQNTTGLKEFLESRFYKMVESIYQIEKNKNIKE